MTHLTGKCHGGPFDGRSMTHHAYGYRLAYYLRSPMKAIPGMVSSSDPEIGFGLYAFDGAERIWNWRATADRVLSKSSVDSDHAKRLVP